MTKTTVLTMALCLLAATACADKMTQDSGTSGMPGPSPQAATTTTTTPAAATYGVVQAIDQLQRQDVGLSAMGAAGAAAAGGNMGSPTDKVYRVTVRLDDGSNQMVVEESMPGYKIGDRVRYSNGRVQAY
ncbi:hypothetical protein GJ698_16035 [Pseudoduganella sp. FT26W]|uniref:Lipoprotein n=1 Tax=Duganella aquatilis TaxID=2666082 RepID=A0A844CYR2_9BURK|nr:hypothetical protein [Duganella aquatilis]MRW85593.1 hypothetical protein [Duganella aquatilis]